MGRLCSDSGRPTTKLERVLGTPTLPYKKKGGCSRVKGNTPLRLFLPAIFILCVVVVMAAFIAWSTWQNMDRDRRNAVKQLLREADILVQAIQKDVMARSGRGEALENGLKEIARDMGAWENVTEICFRDIRTGHILHAHSRFSNAAPCRHGLSWDGSFHRIIKEKGGGFTLLLIRPLFFSHARPASVSSGDIVGAGDLALPADVAVEMGLAMDMYGAARQADLRHAGIMIGILLVLGGGAVYFIFIIRNYLRDIHRMQRLERQIQKSEKLAAIGQLSASVAHEIRNPLSSIRGFARFFAHLFKDRDEHREYADIMVKELDRINGVITDLITYAGPLEPRMAPVDPRKLVTHMRRLIEGDTRSRGVIISMDIPENMPPVTMDGDQMKQVFLNLLLNALNVLKPGEKIVVGASSTAPGTGGGRFWVADEGPGIPREHQARIFDPFFSGASKGTGLGLAIVKKIIENHGGTISVESPAPGKSKGCCFTITLPGDGKPLD